MHVRDTSTDLPRQPFLRSGDAIRESGIYRVFHNSHRGSHEVTLLRDEVFPPCERCGDDVRFERLRTLNESSSLRIRLYKLPHVIAAEGDQWDGGARTFIDRCATRQMAAMQRVLAKKTRAEAQRLRRVSHVTREKMGRRWLQCAECRVLLRATPQRDGYAGAY
jgi:hypothetical protein